MQQNFYELVWIFIIYAFIGWCTEVSYAALDTGKFVNRGFLNGPYCPIYGCGVVIVVAILTPLKENLLILFAGSFLLTSVLEYITGYILEKVFHNKWWDYSDKPFNIKGYVCLKFSIYWGLACTFIMDIIHPIIYAAIRFIPFVLGVVLLSIIMCVFAADCIITVTTILKFNKRLKVMDEMAASIHRLSDEIGENIYENVTDVIEKSAKFQETHMELMDKISKSKHVGILGTTGTITSDSYSLEIKKMFPHMTVTGEACPMWVPLVENNEFDSPGADYFVRKHLEHILAADPEIDTLVLGCTHYPLLIEKIKAFLPEGITLFSQGEYVAASLTDYLRRHPEMDIRLTKQGNCRFLTTESAAKFSDAASVFLNHPVEVEQIRLVE